MLYPFITIIAAAQQRLQEDRGQSTAEYALLLLGAATIALICHLGDEKQTRGKGHPAPGCLNC